MTKAENIHTYKWHTYYTCVFSMNLLKATHIHTAFILAHVHASTLVLNPYTSQNAYVDFDIPNKLTLHEFIKI